MRTSSALHLTILGLCFGCGEPLGEEAEVAGGVESGVVMIADLGADRVALVSNGLPYPCKRGTNIEGGAAKIRGESFDARGVLGCHADSEVRIQLGDGSELATFSADVGLDDYVVSWARGGHCGRTSPTDVQYTFLLDGVVAHETPVLTYESPKHHVELPIAGKRVLTMRTRKVTLDWCDHTDFVNVAFKRAVAEPCSASAVTNLSAALTATNDVRLTWAAPAGVASQKVYRKDTNGSGAFALIATVAAGATSHVDNPPNPAAGASHNWHYSYQVVGSCDGVDGAPSNTATLLVPPPIRDGGTPPPAPAPAPAPSGVCLPAIPSDAVPVRPGEDIQRAVDAAQAGTTIRLLAGTHTLARPLFLKSGIRLRGEGPERTTLTPGYRDVGSNPHGAAIVIRGGMSDITIGGIKLTKGGMLIGGPGARTSDIRIVGNEITGIVNPIIWDQPQTIFLENVDRVVIEQNHIHHNTAGYDNIKGYALSNSSISYNEINNNRRTQHLIGLLDNVTVAYNWIHDVDGGPAIGEFQRGERTVNLLVEGNVVKDHYGLYQENYCISLAIPGATNTRFSNNYCSGTAAPNAYWVRPAERRLAYIEFMSATGRANGNVMISPRTLSARNPSDGDRIVSGGSYAAFIVYGHNTQTFDFRDNRFYGETFWGVDFGQDGNSPAGPIDRSGTTVDRDISHAPPLPARPVKRCS